MTDTLQNLWDLWERMRSGAVPTATVTKIPRDQCIPRETAGYRIIADKMYFAVRLNEMHLAANRQWWTKYDPLVVVVTEFDYGGKRIAIPSIVGPDLISDPTNGGKPMHGVVLEDTLVAGPHPYRGGDVVISVRFYRLLRDDFVRAVLKTVNMFSKAVGGFHELDATIATGSAILTGLEGLLNLGTTVCLAAYRGSLAPTITKPFAAQFSTLITPPTPTDPAALSVQHRRLFTAAPTSTTPYRDSDFVLISVEGTTDRDDLNRLPFNARRIAALKALAEGKSGFTRAKSLIITGYGEMLASPEMTSGQADRVFDSWRNELTATKERLDKTRAMSQEDDESALPSFATKLNGAVQLLDF